MPEISQEELDKLRALQAREETRLNSPLGAPEGEGLAARSIADYLRGAGPLSRGGGGGGGGLSYGGNTSGGTPNFRALAAERGLARDAGASVAELQAADAVNRQTNENNPFGYNDRQTKALELAWSSSPDKVALDAENVERAKSGLPAIQSDYGLNRYHVNPDGSRNYNYSADGQFRGDIPEEFRNEAGNPNTHDAHFNKETGQWEAGDLGLMQTFKDIGGGFKDAYGNISKTIPLIGGEVISGFKDLAGNFGGGNAISGGGKDGVGNFGAVGDFFGGISDNLGLTSYGDLAAKKQAAATQAGPLNSQGRPLSTTDTSGNQFTVNPVFDTPTPSVYTPPASIAPDNRDRQNATQKATAAANRAQLSARKASAKLGSGGALHGGGRKDGGYIHRNMGGYVEYNDGGMVGHRMAGGQFMSGIEHKGTGGDASNYRSFNMGGPVGYMQAGGGIARSLIDDDEEERQRQMQMQQAPLSGGGGIGSQIKNQAIGQAASMATKALFSGLTGGAGGVLSGLFGGNNGGYVQTIQSPLGRSYNNGGPVEGAADVLVKELSSRRPAGLQLPTQQFGHGGGVTATMIPGGGPVKKVKTQNKSSKGHGSKDEMMEIEFDTAVPPMSEMALMALGQK